MSMLERRALIVGCGIAGPVAAMFLQRAGLTPVIYEAAEAPPDEAGAFLSLAPNGVDVLATLGLADRLATAAGAFALAGLVFFNARGRRIGHLDRRSDARRYGTPSMVVKRGLLARLLREEALRRGIKIELGRALERAELTRAGAVVACFADGSETHGDLLVGCDGLRSRTRELVVPGAAPPTYTGHVRHGGFARPGAPRPPPGVMHVTFGRRAAFGAVASPSGEVYWFSRARVRGEPASPDREAISGEGWRRRLLERHRDDPAPIPAVVEATPGELGRWADYDLPVPASWCRGAVCLVGDAAHASSPPDGPGASLAMEDGIVLAKCVRDLLRLEDALAAYQRLRQPRVQLVTEQARRPGQDPPSGGGAGRVRELLLPLVLARAARSARTIHAYRVDWNVRTGS